MYQRAYRQETRQDQVARERIQKFGVHRVNAFSARDKLAHLAVNFGGRHLWINARAKQRGLRRGIGGKIALVADAENRIAETDGVSDFG
ncbi:MAG: hypothetical protein WB559_06845, partial [Candidatus Acidiferrales bacterium]